VRAIGAQRYDQRDGRKKCDQANTEEARAQRKEPPVKGTDKRSLWAPRGQLARECSIINAL
jgi:hypothetical protein